MSTPRIITELGVREVHLGCAAALLRTDFPNYDRNFKSCLWQNAIYFAIFS